MEKEKQEVQEAAAHVDVASQAKEHESLITNLLTMEDQASRSEALEEIRAMYAGVAGELAKSQAELEGLTAENAKLSKTNSILFSKLSVQYKDLTDDSVVAEEKHEEPVEDIEDLME